MIHDSGECEDVYSPVERAHSGYLVCTKCRELLTPSEVAHYIPLAFIIWADPIGSAVRHWYITANQPDDDGDHVWGNFETQVEAMAHAEAHLATELELYGRSLDCRLCHPEVHTHCGCTRRCWLHSVTRRKATR